MSMMKNSFFKDIQAYEVLKGIVDKPQNKNTLKITISTNVEGILKIFHSLDGKTFNHYNDIFTVNSDTHKQVSLKGKYYYIQYENGDESQEGFKLYTTLTEIINNELDVNLNSNDIVTVEGLHFDASGNLKVTGISGGGSGGDASASNQVLQLTEAEQTNDKLDTLNSNVIKCDTDNIVIDSSNPVQVVNLAKVENTLNNAFLTVDALQNLNVKVSNQIDLSTLATQETLAEIKTELTNNMPTKENQIEIGETVQTIEDLMLNVDYTQGYADIYTDAVTLGADSNPSFTTHPTLDGWYYQNTALNGASNLYFYANSGGQQKQHKVSELYSSYVVCNLLNTSNSVNTPFLVVYSKPTGTNDYAPWYHSKWIYKIPNASIISAGQEFMMFQGQLPNQQIFPHIPRVEAVLVETLGEGNKATEDLLFCTVNTDSGATQNTTKVVYTGVGYNLIGRNSIITLGVGKQQQTRDIKDKIDNLSSIVGAGVFVQLDSNVNGLKLKSTLNDGSADVNVVNDIDVNNLTKCDTDNVIIQSGSVNSHIVDIANSPLTFTNVGLKNCADVVINNNSLDVHCFGSSDGSTFHHLKTNPNGVLSTNAIIETNNGTLTSTIDDDVNALDVSVKNVVNANMRTSVNGLLTSTSISGTEVYNALDVKCKGTTDISGNVNLKTNDNGLLTSTLSGTGNSIHALDVSVKNAVVTKSQSTNTTLITTNEYCYCSSPTDSKVLGTFTASTDGYLYANALITITNFSQSGWNQPNIQLQSGDGTNWYNESSTSIYQNGTFKISVYNAVIFPYLRLYLDCSSFTSPNTASFNVSGSIFQK